MDPPRSSTVCRLRGAEVSTSDEDRIAYLSGEAADSLTPQERAELDRLRALLEASATWEEPDAALEDRVVNAIAGESRGRADRHGLA
jgi:hypothetical protein